VQKEAGGREADVASAPKEGGERDGKGRGLATSASPSEGHRHVGIGESGGEHSPQFQTGRESLTTKLRGGKKKISSGCSASNNIGV